MSLRADTFLRDRLKLPRGSCVGVGVRGLQGVSGRIRVAALRVALRQSGPRCRSLGVGLSVEGCAEFASTRFERVHPPDVGSFDETDVRIDTNVNTYVFIPTLIRTY